MLNQVDGVVIDGDSPPFVLLGMSALNRNRDEARWQQRDAHQKILSQQFVPFSQRIRRVIMDGLEVLAAAACCASLTWRGQVSLHRNIESICRFLIALDKRVSE